jgi:hypothetical protein
MIVVCVFHAITLETSACVPEHAETAFALDTQQLQIWYVVIYIYIQ